MLEYYIIFVLFAHQQILKSKIYICRPMIALPQENNRPSKFRIRLSKIDMYFVGAGDLLAALLLVRLICVRHHFVRTEELLLLYFIDLNLSLFLRSYLVQARTAEFPGDICRAVELSVASLQHVLKRTKMYVCFL